MDGWMDGWTDGWPLTCIHMHKYMQADIDTYACKHTHAYVIYIYIYLFIYLYILYSLVDDEVSSYEYSSRLCEQP